MHRHIARLACIDSASELCREFIKRQNETARPVGNLGERRWRQPSCTGIFHQRGDPHAGILNIRPCLTFKLQKLFHIKDIIAFSVV